MTPHRARPSSRRRPWAAALLLLLPVAFALPVAAESPEGYYRFPALRGDTVVFTAEGDLWTVAVTGGVARRLTTHAGEETHAAISPDGATVAFSASYDGPTEVYTMPLAGGVPVRRTWEAEVSEVSGFTPDGRLVYVTQHFATLPDPNLVLLDLADGSREIVPLAQASDADWTADGSTLVFARPYWNRNNTKRYRGGTARNLWRFASGDAEAANLTPDFDGESHAPMSWRDGAGVERVVHVNDRDGFMNLWSMTFDGSDLRQHTRHLGWDVRDPAIDGSRVIYRLGADLRLHDLATGADAKIPIRIASDFDQLRERWVQDPLEYLTSAEIHPKGGSLVLTARGRVFVVPAKAGRTVQLERKPGVRYRDATFMPAGDQVVLLSDETGELELRLVPANGIGEGRALTDDGDILRFGAAPSPDGRFIAYADKNDDLFLLEVATGARRRLNDNREGVGGLAWSPDSKWMVWERTAPNTFRQLMLYSVDADASEALTSDRVNSVSAAWGAKGEWLYFLSDRNLESVVGAPWGARQPDPHIDSSWKLYQMALKRGLRPAFRPPDELHAEQEKAKKDEKKPGEKKDAGAGNGESSGNAEEGDGEKGKAPTVTIDREGLQQRYWEIPVAPGNYFALAAGDGALYWISREGRGFGGAMSLMGVKLEGDLAGDAAKAETVATGIRGYALSADRKKLMIRQGQTFSIVDAKPAKADLSEGKVDLAGFKFPLSQREDYRQLFVDAWRLERDYFYDPGMHGLDWEAVRDKYLPLVDRVTSRVELSDLIGELVSELSALHVSVRGGDLREGDEKIGLGRLGARVRRDPAAGGDVIERIYRHDPDYPDERSPLADPYLGIQEGEVIVAVNGTPVLEVPAIGALLRDLGGEQVRLRIADASEGGAERDVIVTLMENESSLRYADWQVTRREMVEEMGGGDIGYVHLRAMGGNNLTEWYRMFYPVFDRKGLILDVRHNRGGNIDSFLLGKLVRQAWMYWKGRVGQPTWNMQYAFRGHMVVLVDEQTASDGEAFADGFRRLGLGPVIGTRTWGGEIWLGSSNRLTDLGLARAPETGVYGPEREWLIEGWGVDPDVVVDNLPYETFLGKDRQLETAVEVLEQKIAEDPREVPPPPPYPDKTFESWKQDQEAETAAGGSGR
ncbi:MAG TPA: S41 family peptidase [Thermoanaerobaculia bacterium]|nr:S41 family peptidase [Thermoanaerobaculia bacterium]